ncbi:MAG: iron-sulfur cluster assembly scaffold protein, partial [Armatimonadetes bacterium]|nr:iron-sulfur cluster assembly scaffold protein [Armatimonadota bacterium]
MRVSLDDLYQEIILDHGRRPRNFGELEDMSHEAEGFNPLCGDQVRVQVLLKGDRIEDIRFSGRGCAISTA